MNKSTLILTLLLGMMMLFTSSYFSLQKHKYKQGVEVVNEFYSAELEKSFYLP
ncbi:hypothetical protein [Belliella buryatensis]|uniref:hypothetical protein n=1 Tax=Belliella buryatensis TaxID=1500549 RepID=UPI0014826B95|nr:hypothetical protein [Belliella buryatensis]